MTIMPHQPIPAAGTDEVHTTLAEAWPLFAAVQAAAKAGITVAIEVQPSSIRVTIEVPADCARALPELLADLTDTQVASTADGRHTVVGGLCEGTVTAQVVTPPGWVTRTELDILLASGRR
ncbi:hypothetical protein OG330_31045 (plasmid) [Streptomyces albidoflavus]|uniref:Uncharacterized protein n=1 Tax=Streptomyces albidoflavus TaxID=1886 RepID=A0A8G1ZJU4_9ACTN|nr:hypothetical protein [Streptomyces albidoflavus]RZE15337.1 hypothetical protein C0Q92_31070 [Streptomyces albidoflavus]WSU19612.1 hypothetical protein OG330_31045 [Streptomyces albidoflavus]WTC33772.1 hypothetical protein OH749_31165 [Streptomyces albidoflavus]CAI4198583.1 hypothetical protein CCOS2040_31250 [Streptomyces albidoflavus]